MEFAARFKALGYKEENVGKMIKMSKKKYSWEFTMNNKHCLLVLKISKITNNYSIEMNGQLLYKGNMSYDTHFSFKFKIEGILVVIKRVSSEYQLYIQNLPFKEFYESNDRKTKLIRPDPVLNKKDLEKQINKKRNMTVKTKPTEHKIVENGMNKSSPVKEARNKEEIKDIKEIIKETEGFKISIKKDEEENEMEQTDIYEQEYRKTRTTFQFSDNCDNNVYDSSDEEEEQNRLTSITNSDMGEPFEIVILPNDFETETDATKRIIKLCNDSN